MPLVVIDPGHGGYDSGATGYGLFEKDLALQIGLQVADSLRMNYVVDVNMTRDSDVFIPLSSRADLANEWGADYFVSVHLNSGGGEGFESYIYTGTEGTKTETMQTAVHNTVMSFLTSYGVQDRGRKQADFAVIRETNMDAVLLENLFTDNVKDAGLLKQPDFIQGLASAISKGIAAALNLQPLNHQQPTLPPNEPPTGQPTQPATQHWAQGAADELKAAGFLEDDHSASLDNPASEGMVIALFNRLRKALGIDHYGSNLTPPTSTTPSTHWAKSANDEMMAAGLLESDHTPYLDDPATEAMVIVLADRIWKAKKT